MCSPYSGTFFTSQRGTWIRVQGSVSDTPHPSPHGAQRGRNQCEASLGTLRFQDYQPEPFCYPDQSKFILSVCWMDVSFLSGNRTTLSLFHKPFDIAIQFVSICFLALQFLYLRQTKSKSRQNARLSYRV